MDAAFERAVDIVARLSKSGPIQTSYDDKLLLYALFKQATAGPPRTNRPGVLDLLGRAKWDAWKRKEGLNDYQAKKGYVEALKKILRGYGDRQEATDFVREIDRLLSQGEPGDLVISGSLADSDVSSDEERRTYQPPPPRVRQESSQASTSRGYAGAPGPQRGAQRSQRPPRRRDDETLSSEGGSPAVSPPPIATGRERFQSNNSSLHRQAIPAAIPPVSRYAPSIPGSAYATSRAPMPYASPSLGSAQGQSYLPVRPLSTSQQLRSPYAPPPAAVGTPGPDIEGLRQKLSALEAFLTQPDVPEDRRRQVEIEIAKTRGYLAVISQRFNALTPTSGITLSELQARQQQTIQRISPAPPPPVTGLERALDNIQTSLTALNERLSRLESKPRSVPPPEPPAPLPIMELINRLLFFLRLREAPRGLPQWGWVTMLTMVRGAVTDVAFLVFLVGLLFSVQRHGLSWRAFRETWTRLLLLGGSEVARRIEV